ncbi:pentapeptide repeat-containing protein [Saccharomonospora piscinae]|uniref:pentapeptide repeat-containing protein n=1 Tax=Saccharomonospora piscinae TaxID=687388 RepID=UPI001106482C|nr:pentapeptide repeat-containing protein [Saccharomonospora piscinae]TLW91116.1 pentapeptide repeat-containing protein [Saccharomonospora piscinae]
MITARPRRRFTEPAPRPLSWWLVAAYAAAAVAIGAGVAWWTWPGEVGTAAQRATIEIQSVRTGLAATGGAGAAFTLLLAVRRQRSTELMDTATRHDADQRRVTDLYTVAVEQLGEDSAALRLGGLYALERLGQEHPVQRRLIVNVWCAYLRMSAPDPDAAELSEAERTAHRQELQVRHTVQTLLREHVHRAPRSELPPDPEYWGDDLDIDLTGATLHQLDLSDRRLHRNTTFAGARFVGETAFDRALFAGIARFDRAVFLGPCGFRGAEFTGEARFLHADFGGRADFAEARFHGNADFAAARFGGRADFARTLVSRHTYFEDARAVAGRDHVWPVGWRALATRSPGELPHTSLRLTRHDS